MRGERWEQGDRWEREEKKLRQSKKRWWRTRGETMEMDIKKI